MVTSAVFSAAFYLLLFVLLRPLFLLVRKADPAAPAAVRGCFRHDTLVACLLYGICTLLFFYPALKEISVSLIGPPSDNMLHAWNIWWTQQVFSGAHAHFAYTGMLYYPEGVSLLYDPFSFYNMFLALPLLKFFTLPLTYNILIMGSFLLAGIGAFALTRYLTGNSCAGLAGGFIFAFNPAHFAHSLYHLESCSIQFIPFCVLFFIKAVRGASKKDTALAALFFLLVSLCSWYYMAFGIYFIVLGYIYLAYRRGQVWLKDYALKSAVMLSGGLAFLFPWLFSMVRAGMRSPELTKPGMASYAISDPLAFLIPHPFHLLSGVPVVRTINSWFIGNDCEKTVYLGVVSILIVLISLKGIKRQAGKYFLGLFAFLLLSMGAYLHFAGRTFPVYLPMAFISRIPFVSGVRSASRFMMCAYLFWAVIVSYALAYLAGKYKGHWWRNIALAAAVAMMAADYFSVGITMTPYRLPAYYQAIPKGGARFGILDLPEGGFFEGERYMFYQTMHHIPIVEACVERRESGKLIDRLEVHDLGIQKEQLAKAGVKYIVVHKDLNVPGKPVDLPRYQGTYRQVYSDKDAVVLQVY